jgi:hypothetical protein
VAWDTQLADQENVQGGIECFGDLEPDRHAATWERQHQHVGTVGIVGEPGGEHLAGVSAIAKRAHACSP